MWSHFDLLWKRLLVAWRKSCATLVHSLVLAVKLVML